MTPKIAPWVGVIVQALNCNENERKHLAAAIWNPIYMNWYMAMDALNKKILNPHKSMVFIQPLEKLNVQII